MTDILVSILQIVAPLSVALVVFSQGLRVAPSRVLSTFKDQPWLILRILLAVIVLVPAAALAIVLGLHPGPGVAIGIAILVACPPAPLMVSSAPKKGASAELMAALHVGLSLLAFVTVPAVLFALSRPLGFDPEIDMGAMGWTLARTNIIPIVLGLTVRGLAPALAERLAPILGKVAMIGVLVVVLFALAKFYPALLDMDPWSYLVIALVSIAALAIGYFAGPDDPGEKTGFAIECGVRHPALAVAIAGATFSSAQALPVLVPCVITFMLVATIYLSISSRRQQPTTAA